MEHRDISAVHKLLTEYLKQFHLTPVMSREEVEHWFLPQENIIDTFVVEVRGREQDGEVFSWDSASTGAVGAICCPGQGDALLGERFELLEIGVSIELPRVSSQGAHTSLRLAQPL